MPKFQDLTGLCFGRLTVLRCLEKARKLADGRKTHTRWFAQCECGNLVTPRSDALLSGVSQSCGCLHAEITSGRQTSHGMSDSPEYKAWAAMLQRCTNSNAPSYLHYGGRGIAVDPLWSSFENFYADMGPRPSPFHTLERLNNNLGYTRNNCSWELHQTQMNNTRQNKMLLFNGTVKTLMQWCRELNLPYSTIQSRLHACGWSADRALSTPTKKPFMERKR
jgi:hypothetical protein